MIKDLLEQYAEAQRQIHALFGYTGGPFLIGDLTDCKWFRHNGEIWWSDEPLTPGAIEAGTDLYSIYAIQEWRADGYVMAYAPSNTVVGNTLEVFDSSKEIKPTSEQLEALELW